MLILRSIWAAGLTICCAPEKPRPEPAEAQPQVQGAASPPSGSFAHPAESVSATKVRIVGDIWVDMDGPPRLTMAVDLVNRDSSPAWFVLRTRDLTALPSSKSLVVWQDLTLRPSEVKAFRGGISSAPPLQLCDGYDCDQVILVPPGALSFEIHIFGPMQDFTVEVWRLAALQFDGARADEWLAGAEGTAFREGPGDDRAPQIGRVSVDIVERFAFPMEHRTP